MKGDDVFMTMKFIKKMLAVTLAATMMVAPALTVCATTEPSAPAASSGTTEAPNPFKEAISATTPQRLGGQTLKSDVPGTIRPYHGTYSYRCPLYEACGRR